MDKNIMDKQRSYP